MFNEKDEAMKAKYRALFSSPLGVEVLADMLTDLGEPCVIEADPAQVAWKNYAEHLWNCCGVRDDVKATDYVAKMFEIEAVNAKGDAE